MRELRVPYQVRYAPAGDDGMVLLNCANGHWYALNAVAASLWRAWATGVSYDEAVFQVIDAYDETSAEDIQRDAHELVTDLLACGLLSVDRRMARKANRSVHIPQTSGALPPDDEPLVQEVSHPALITVAFLTILVAATLTRLSFRATCLLICAVRSATRSREPSPERAAAVLAVINRAARCYPGRAACLERSAAAALLGALLRRRLTLCLGAVADPYRFHAWIEAGGRRIADPGDRFPETSYITILAL